MTHHHRTCIASSALAAVVLAVSACAGTTPQPASPALTVAPTEAPTAAPTEAPTAASTEAPVAGRTRIVVDSRGVEVKVPAVIRTVATISDAMVEEVMHALKVDARVNTIGSTCLVRDFTYDFTSNSGEKFSYFGGMNPGNYLNEYLRDLPFFVKPGTEMNFETLASAAPDVLIIHAGTCTINWRAGDDAAMNSTLEKLQGLGIPTVVVYGPNFSGEPSIESLSQGIRIIGQVFDKAAEAERLAAYLESQVNLVRERTKDIPEDQKPRVLIFGLNPNVRKEGGSGSADGLKSIQSYLLENVVNAKNAFQDDSFSKNLNAEQVLALDPDVIILPTSNGYHPPRELYDTPDFKNLETLRAIQQRRIASLPWSPCNCDKRLEYPIDVMVMAKAIYPERFADINLERWLIDFFKNVYDVDEDTADGLLSALWMDWVRDQQ